MELEWVFSFESINWQELSDLYRVAPLGDKKPLALETVPGKEPFYRKLGFMRMTTAMAIFENQAQALELGLVNET